MKEREKDVPRCGRCRHFIQHYRRTTDETYTWVNCGHCVQGRIKQRSNTKKACEHYAPGENGDPISEKYK